MPMDILKVLEKTRALLQQLSVIGRQFPVSLIKQVVPQPEDELYRVLSSLQAKEFLYEQSAFPEVEYLFKHTPSSPWSTIGSQKGFDTPDLKDAKALLEELC